MLLELTGGALRRHRGGEALVARTPGRQPEATLRRLVLHLGRRVRRPARRGCHALDRAGHALHAPSRARAERARKERLERRDRAERSRRLVAAREEILRANLVLPDRLLQIAERRVGRLAAAHGPHHPTLRGGDLRALRVNLELVTAV